MKTKLFNMRFIFIGILLFLIGNNYALVGDWSSYTYLNRVKDLISYSGNVYMATSGGIRILNSNGSETVLNNPQDGILDVDVVGFTTDSKGNLWAVSNSGIIYELSAAGSKNTPYYNRNFSNYAGRVNERALATAGSFLIMGSTKGLSFFLLEDVGDFERGTFYETLYDFGNAKNPSVTAIHIDGQEITIGTSAGIFQADIYWDNPKSPPENFSEKYGRLLNPNIWKGVKADSTLGLTSESEVGAIWKNGNNILASGPGKLLSSSPLLFVEKGQPLVYKGTSYASNLSASSIAEANGTLYLGDTTGAYVLSSGKFKKISNAQSLPKGQIINVSALNGNVSIWNLDYFSSILGWTNILNLQGRKWVSSPRLDYPHIIEPIAKRLNVYFQIKEDVHLIGNWGYGIQKIENGISSYVNSANSCMEGIPADPNFAVVRSMSSYGDKGAFFTQYTTTIPLNIGYLDYDNFSVSCYPKSILTDELAAFAQDIKVVAENFLLVSTNKSLELFEIINPRSSSGISPVKNAYIEASGSPEIRAANMDNFGRVWAVANAGIYFGENFIDSDDDSLVLVENMEALECNYLKKDPAGNLWAACRNGLLQIKPELENSETEIIFHKNLNGLLSEDVFHIDIDPSNGHVWIVTEKGLNKFEAEGAPPLSNNNDAQVFPNPFLAKHEFAIFSELNNNSSIKIFNQGGDIVFQTRDGEIEGGQFKWNGANRSGNRVKAGVYYYSIVADGKIKKGKLIIAR